MMMGKIDDGDDDNEVLMHNSCKCMNHLLPFQFELTLFIMMMMMIIVMMMVVIMMMPLCG